MSVTIGRHGGTGRQGVDSGGVSMVTSDMSTNSNSSTFFATFGASVATGLKGPGLFRWAAPVLCPAVSSALPAESAAAKKSQPEVGLNVGISARASTWGDSTLPRSVKSQIHIRHQQRSGKCLVI